MGPSRGLVPDNTGSLSPLFAVHDGAPGNGARAPRRIFIMTAVTAAGPCRVSLEESDTDRNPSADIPP